MATELASSHALFKGLIDYAGLFPPAALALPEAVANYRAYLGSADRWMLGRFIATTAHVLNLTEDLLEGYSGKHPLEISLVTKDPVSDLPKVLAHTARYHGAISISALEVPLSCGENFEGVLSRIDGVLSSIVSTVGRVPVFYELTNGAEWEGQLAVLTRAIERRRSAGGSLGYKLRCGGLEPHLIPTPERVALAITECAARGIPMKFTAGLHHPFRHSQKEPFPPMHGYFNVFFAACVAHRGKVAQELVCKLLSEMSDVAPRFTSDGIAWLGESLSTTQIGAARERFAISYGSCSFSEPLEDAVKLGWL